jgi:hypothetical protein
MFVVEIEDGLIGGQHGGERDMRTTNEKLARPQIHLT